MFHAPVKTNASKIARIYPGFLFLRRFKVGSGAVEGRCQRKSNPSVDKQWTPHHEGTLHHEIRIFDVARKRVVKTKDTVYCGPFMHQDYVTVTKMHPSNEFCCVVQQKFGAVRPYTRIQFNECFTDQNPSEKSVTEAGLNVEGQLHEAERFLNKQFCETSDMSVLDYLYDIKPPATALPDVVKVDPILQYCSIIRESCPRKQVDQNFVNKSTIKSVVDDRSEEEFAASLRNRERCLRLCFDNMDMCGNEHWESDLVSSVFIDIKKDKGQDTREITSKVLHWKKREAYDQIAARFFKETIQNRETFSPELPFPEYRKEALKHKKASKTLMDSVVTHALPTVENCIVFKPKQESTNCEVDLIGGSKDFFNEATNQMSPKENLAMLPNSESEVSNELSASQVFPKEIQKRSPKNLQLQIKKHAIFNRVDTDLILNKMTKLQEETVAKGATDSKEHTQLLDLMCLQAFAAHYPHEGELVRRDKIRLELQELLREQYDEKVELSLFGSSKNGFTFRDSDLDISLTIKGNKTGQNLRLPGIVRNISYILAQSPKVCKVEPILYAKVPIVKFYLPDDDCEADICIYNRLALRNTDLLASYASVDGRCRTLGYKIKALAKDHDICCTWGGTLSSYAYIILVIYFLQQHDPPVLPVLQELYSGEKPPTDTVDGWNCWFYDDLDKITDVWEGYGKNTQSVGELWRDLVTFYKEKFNFEQEVVSIRRKDRLSKREKVSTLPGLAASDSHERKRKLKFSHWTSRSMFIEDPFDHGHNLASVVTASTAKYIKSILTNQKYDFKQARSLT